MQSAQTTASSTLNHAASERLYLATLADSTPAQERGRAIGPKLDPKQRAEMLALVVSGVLSIAEAARAYGIRPANVCKALRSRAGIAAREAAKPTTADDMQRAARAREAKQSRRIAQGQARAGASREHGLYFSPEERAAMVRAVAGGESLNAVARLHGAHVSSVRYHVRKARERGVL